MTGKNLDNASVDPKTAIRIKKILKENEIALRRNRRQFNSATRVLDKIWRGPLSLLEQYWFLSITTASRYGKRYGPIAEKEENLVYLALSNLHANSLGVGYEIIVLLRNGSADGAMSRWRKLHEIAVISEIIRKHGNQTARRFLLHEKAKRCQSACEFNNYAERLNQEKIPESEVKNAKKTLDKLKIDFGKDYGTSYGWASDIFEHKVSFSTLELEAGLDRFHPYYDMANILVHADSRTLTFGLGIPGPIKKVVQIGPSTAGLTEPGQSMLISMNKINEAFFMLYLDKRKNDKEALAIATCQSSRF